MVQVKHLFLNKMLSKDKIEMSVASSGITARELQICRTVHSCFKISIKLDFNENSVSVIAQCTTKSYNLMGCVLIVWHECTIVHRNSVEFVDRAL